MSDSVLVVDDDQAMCETLQACLERSGLAVAWRTSAVEALALLEAQPCDVVLTDVNMGEVGGLALCARVAVLRPGLPVIVTSAFATPEVRQGAMSAGAVEFIAKPFDLEYLRLALRRAIERGSSTPRRASPSIGLKGS